MEKLRADIRKILTLSISANYIKNILDAIEEDIIRDVIVCSSYEEDGLYNENDIHLAIGRVLMDKMGIVY